MQPIDIAKMIVSTDTGMDKVLETFSGAFSAAARFGAFQPRLTDHPTGYSPEDWGLLIGSYSLDNSTWFPFGITDADTSGPQPIFQTVEVNAYCSDSDIVVQASNFKSSGVTVYYAFQLVSRD